MNDLPDSWTMASLAAVSVECEQRIPAADATFQYIDIASIDRATKSILTPQTLLGRNAPSRARKVVRTGDVLVSMTRPNLNAVGLVPEIFNGQIASTGFDVLRANGVEPRWLFYLVRTEGFVQSMSQLVQGALYPAVRSKDIRGHEVPIAPLNEQKRIADKLDTLLARVDACRERLDRVPAILKRFRQSVLAAATSGDLTEAWREEMPRAGLWREVSLDDVALDFTYGSASKSAKHGAVPVLHMGNIQDGRLDWTDLVFTSDATEISKYSLSAGDVLFNRTNSPELVGKTAVYRGDRPAIYAGYLIRVRCRDHLLPDYLNYCLNSPAGRDYRWRVKSDGVSQSNINARKLSKFRFALPSREEQEEIVHRVEALFAYADRLEARYTAARVHVERLTPALLAKAFRGELLPQDPNDEPASVLLERIRAARAAIPPKPRSRQGAGRQTKTQKIEVLMLNRQHITDAHLCTILRERGPLTAEALWSASQLDIDDFYDQLQDEEARGLLNEQRGDSPSAQRLLEAAA